MIISTIGLLVIKLKPKKMKGIFDNIVVIYCQFGNFKMINKKRSM